MERTHLIDQCPAFATVFADVGQIQLAAFFKPAFVSLVGAVLGQKVPFKTAQTMRRQLYEGLGTTFTPQQCSAWLAGSEPNLWPADRVRLVSDVADYCIAQEQTDASFWANPGDALRQVVHNVCGLGPWTLSTALLCSGLDMDVFPVEDLFLRRRLQRLFGLAQDRLYTVAEARALVAPWAPHRGYAALYLWRWF